MRSALGAAGALLAIAVATAAPASAENPVYDAETAADIAAAFAEATEVQGVCYALTLDVSDPSGVYGGMYIVSSAGVDQAPAVGCKSLVELRASLVYTSEYSEAQDSATWYVTSTLAGPTAADLERNGLSAGSLLNDSESEQVLLNAALALPRLTAETVDGVPPLVLTPATESPPTDARATDRPGSDRYRQNKTPVVLLGLVALASLAWAFSLIRRPRRTWSPPPPYASGQFPLQTHPDDLPRPEQL